MKRFFLALFLSIFGSIFAQEERITFFGSKIDVDSTSITVTENINAFSQGVNIRRGIFRTLPLKRTINGKNIQVRYDILSVKMNGITSDYHTKTDDGNFKIYVGSENDFLTPGIEYQYEIKYKTDNQIGFFKNYDELYWNVTGNDWDFKIDSVSATVNLPAKAKIIQNSCYTGTYGSSTNDCSSSIKGNSITWKAKNLSYYEGLTVAVGFNKGVVKMPPPPSFFEKFGLFLALFLTILGFAYFLYKSWVKYGIDPVKPTVYPQFNVPNNLSPASLAYLKNEYLDQNYITASIVNLAVKGFIKIKEAKEEQFFGYKNIYIIQKLKGTNNPLPTEEVKIMNGFFKGKDEIQIDGEYDENIASTMSDYTSNLKFQHSNFIDEGNNSLKLFFPLLFVLAIAGISFYMSYKMSPDSDFIYFGNILLVATTIAFIITFFIKKGKDVAYWLLGIAFAGLSIFILIKMMMDENISYTFNYYTTYLFLIFGVALLFVYREYIKKPSIEKLTIQSLIDGFKMYMSAAENETLKFHNPPQMTPELFEKFLPYAIVMGVDDIWGNKFQNILKNSSTEEYHSTWYVGNNFHVNNFSGSFGSAFTNSITTASTSSSSGSGGGGFSGGGGGGGGGGGW